MSPFQVVIGHKLSKLYLAFDLKLSMKIVLVKSLPIKCRFLTVLKLYSKYCKNKQGLFAELDKQDRNDSVSKLEMIRELYKIVNEKQYKMKL